MKVFTLVGLDICCSCEPMADDDCTRVVAVYSNRQAAEHEVDRLQKLEIIPPFVKYHHFMRYWVEEHEVIE